MTKEQSLAKIFEKLGGGAPDASVGGEDAIISEIADVLRGDGIELPEVTAEDNGDVLSVVDGKWSKMTPVVPTDEPKFKRMYCNFSIDSTTLTITINAGIDELAQALLTDVDEIIVVGEYSKLCQAHLRVASNNQGEYTVAGEVIAKYANAIYRLGISSSGYSGSETTEFNVSLQ